MWLFKPLVGSGTGIHSMQISDIRDIASTLEKGSRILREVEPFFAVENPALLPLLERISAEISDF